MNKRNIIIGCVVIVLIIVGIIVNNSKTVESVNNNYEERNIQSSSQIIVDIKGEVKTPGIYYLDGNSRIIDAVNIAGGFTNEADLESINLATKLEDGMIVNVFKKNTIEVKKISINKATIDELTKISGIGEAKAKSIIDYRNKHGKFMSLEEITKVDGISKDTFNKIKEFICL